jgi:hypothetical protein
MRRSDRLKALLESRKRTAVYLTEFPTWCIPAHALAQIEDGTVQQVALSWADGVRVWVAKSKGLVIACGPVGRATPEEVAAWCQARFAEIAQQAKRPRPAPQHDPVGDIWKP